MVCVYGEVVICRVVFCFVLFGPSYSSVWSLPPFIASTHSTMRVTIISCSCSSIGTLHFLSLAAFLLTHSCCRCRQDTARTLLLVFVGISHAGDFISQTRFNFSFFGLFTAECACVSARERAKMRGCSPTLSITSLPLFRQEFHSLCSSSLLSSSCPSLLFSILNSNSFRGHFSTSLKLTVQSSFSKGCASVCVSVRIVSKKATKSQASDADVLFAQQILRYTTMLSIDTLCRHAC